jgi:hypothetical protein
MAYFGYAPQETLPATFLDHQAEFLRAVSERLSAANAQCSDLAAQIPRPFGRTPDTPEGASTRNNRPASKPPLGLVEADPALNWRLKPNASAETTVLGRRVVIEVDSIGCRAVVGQPQVGEKTLAVYGCSFTLGWAIADEETFCSLLQSMFPTWRVENHGVGGYGGTQNLIQLQRDSRWAAADYVTFCWIPHHMLRNVADLSWIQLMTKRAKEADLMDGVSKNATLERPQSMFPRASLDQDGKLQYRTVKVPRWDLLGIDWTDFSPDPYSLDLVCFGLFQRAAEIVNENGGHFFVTTLQGHFSRHLRQLLDDSGIPVVDASVDGVEYTCLPDDPHPNALANRIFARKIRDYLVQHGAT